LFSLGYLRETWQSFADGHSPKGDESMHMRGQKERRFVVNLSHISGFQFSSQASEAGQLHGGSYISDEPDPVGTASGPATPALLGSAIGHCLSASLLESLRHAHIDVLGFETEVVAVVKPNAEGLPRIDHVDVQLKPTIREVSAGAERCAGVFEKNCTVCSSLKEGIDVRIRLDWKIERCDSVIPQ
jgi:organic hydroperoxide reductase OsmC/OhrA